jgi:hypothetical protein
MFARRFYENSPEDSAMNDWLLIRWSAVRTRPGEPLLASSASKSMHNYPGKKPVFSWLT